MTFCVLRQHIFVLFKTALQIKPSWIRASARLKGLCGLGIFKAKSSGPLGSCDADFLVFSFPLCILSFLVYLSAFICVCFSVLFSVCVSLAVSSSVCWPRVCESLFSPPSNEVWSQYENTEMQTAPLFLNPFETGVSV